MPKNLLQVNYHQFRHIINTAGGNKIKNKGASTFVYDDNHHLLAVLKAASVDDLGHTNPTQYYVLHTA